jgi:formate dehydrogenase
LKKILRINEITIMTELDLKNQLQLKNKLKGRQVDALSLSEIKHCVGEHDLERDKLIENLHKINDAFLGLQERHLAALSHWMNLPMSVVFEVASFYHHFEIFNDGEYQKRYTLRVCNGLSCELAGSKDLHQDLKETCLTLGIHLVTAPCVGRCESAPVVVYHQNAIEKACLSSVKNALELSDVAAKVETYIGFDSYRASGGYQILEDLKTDRLNALSVIDVLDNAGLRGLGGAGFPAAKKWRIVRQEPSPRLMAVNIDEGEPGTFKDRTLLEADPHRFIEGMLIAAHVVDVKAIYIYLRDEYHACRLLLQAELKNLQALGHLNLPEIHLRRGAGAYICGEESAMIQSIEGKRGEPRMRPPYIAQVGLFGRPTLEHNFETLFWIRELIEKGPQWFSDFGRQGRKGLRHFSVSGRVRLPGLKLAPAGITVQELIDEYCGGMLDGHELYAYLPGGASGGILPATKNDIPLDFDTLQAHGCFIGSAAVIVLGHHDLARDAAYNMVGFFKEESCGQCTPCRVGSEKAHELMKLNVWPTQSLNDLNSVMLNASICGLGQAIPNPIRCIQTYFQDEVS